MLEVRHINLPDEMTGVWIVKDGKARYVFDDRALKYSHNSLSLPGRFTEELGLIGGERVNFYNSRNRHIATGSVSKSGDQASIGFPKKRDNKDIIITAKITN